MFEMPIKHNIQYVLIVYFICYYSVYMSPEYAMGGLFSTKSDVYIFGVLLLEIINGRRNNAYHQECPYINIVGHVSKLNLCCLTSLFSFSYSKLIVVNFLGLEPMGRRKSIGYYQFVTRKVIPGR